MPRPRKTLLRPLSPAERELAAANFDLIAQAVRTYHSFARSIDDPQGVAALGLLEAAQTWNREKSAFSTWAMRKMRSRLRVAWRAGWMRNRVIPITAFASFREGEQEVTASVVERGTARVDVTDFLDAAMKCYYTDHGMEKRVMELMRYLPSEAVAREMKISRDHVSVLFHAGCRRLRRRMGLLRCA